MKDDTVSIELFSDDEEDAQPPTKKKATEVGSPTPTNYIQRLCCASCGAFFDVAEKTDLSRNCYWKCLGSQFEGASSDGVRTEVLSSRSMCSDQPTSDKGHHERMEAEKHANLGYVNGHETFIPTTFEFEQILCEKLGCHNQ